MASFENGTIVKRKELRIGDVIRIRMSIDVLDIADPLSGTANR